MTRIIPAAIVSLLLWLTVASASPESGGAGLVEKTGNVIPPDLIFSDETGAKVNLRDMIDKPTMLAVIYYSCSHLCPQFLGGLAGSLEELKLTAGRDYRVITVSFDENDTPEVARNIKRNYLRAVDKPFPDNAWSFLTGSRENTGKLLDALGIGVEKAGHGFIHPEVLIFLSRGGMITRYMQVSKYDYGLSYPIRFTDFELTNAIAEAKEGKVCTAGRTTPLYCFLHEPSGQQKFLAMMKIAGIFSIVMVVSFFFFLKREERLRKRRIELGRRDG